MNQNQQQQLQPPELSRVDSQQAAESIRPVSSLLSHFETLSHASGTPPPSHSHQGQNHIQNQAQQQQQQHPQQLHASPASSPAPYLQQKSSRDRLVSSHIPSHAYDHDRRRQPSPSLHDSLRSADRPPSPSPPPPPPPLRSLRNQTAAEPRHGRVSPSPKGRSAESRMPSVGREVPPVKSSYSTPDGSVTASSSSALPGASIAGSSLQSSSLLPPPPPSSSSSQFQAHQSQSQIHAHSPLHSSAGSQQSPFTPSRRDDETYSDHSSRLDQTHRVSSTQLARNGVTDRFSPSVLNLQQTAHKPQHLTPDTATAAAAATAAASKPAKPPPHTKPKVPAKKPGLAHLEVDGSSTNLTTNLTASTDSVDRLSPFSTPPGTPEKTSAVHVNGHASRAASVTPFTLPDQQQESQQLQPSLPRRERAPTPPASRSQTRRLSPPREIQDSSSSPFIDRSRSYRLPPRRGDLTNPETAVGRAQSQRLPYRTAAQQKIYDGPPEPPGLRREQPRHYRDPRDQGFVRQQQQQRQHYSSSPPPISERPRTQSGKRHGPPPPLQAPQRTATLPLDIGDRPQDRPGLPPRTRNPAPQATTPAPALAAAQKSPITPIPPNPNESSSERSLSAPRNISGPVRRPSATDVLPPRSPATARMIGDPGTNFPPPPVRRDTGLALRSGSNGLSPSSLENHPPAPQLTRASTFGDARSFGASPPAVSTSVPPFQPPLPQRRSTIRLESDESDEPPVTVPPPSTLPPPIKGEFPDPSNINRRPPYFGYAESGGVDTRLDTRQMDICGRYAVTTGFFTNVWDVVTGNPVMTLSHQETMKCSCVIFKPAGNFDDEGKIVWLGTITGELMEIDISTQLTVASRQLPTRRDIVKLYRHKRELWVLDGDGTLYVFPPDESGEPNLMGQFIQAPERVPKGMTYSMVVGDHLWYMIRKEINIYNPNAEDGVGFRVLKTPVTFNHAGDVTTGAYSRENDLVYLGHADGKISTYAVQDLSLQHSVASSVYKVSGLVVLDNLLWAGYTTGTICVFDTSTSPWLVKKEWLAHKDGICSLILDTRSLAKLERLQIASLGVDKHIRIWDGLLHEDWIEERMHSCEEQYCEFGKITAAVLTWNAGASVPNHLRDNAFIRDAIHPESPPDIIIFGFQELVDLENKKITAKSLLKSKKKDKDRDPDREQHMSRQYRVWKEYLASCIDQMMPVNASYTHLHTANLIGLFTCVFVRDELRHSIKDLGSMQVKRGMGGLHGNKGALVLRFIIEDTSICLVNCHLAAGQTHTGQRNNDIAAILETGSLPIESSSARRLDRFVGGGDGSQILDHEVCILNGDLNYRIDSIPRNTVVEAVKKKNLTKLLDRDQLLASRRKNPLFRLRAFREEPITFAPTYKYDVGSDRYDTSDKKRAPAWCDRLLYRGAGRVKQIEYRRHENMASDHRPVSGIFRIRIKTVRAKERAEVFEKCRQEWTEESKRLRTIISLDYLVGFLGLDYNDAKNRLLTL